MGKLENISKKQVFEVPEGYFDRLPGIIQSRVALPARSSRGAVLVYSLRFALPTLLFAAAAVLFIPRPSPPQTAEELLATVSTRDLVAYLEDTDLTSDEVMDAIDYDSFDMTQLEDSVYQLPAGNADAILRELDLNQDF